MRLFTAKACETTFYRTLKKYEYVCSFLVGLWKNSKLNSAERKRIKLYL